MFGVVLGLVVIFCFLLILPRWVVVDVGRGYFGKSAFTALSLQIFLLIWEDENCGPGRENFLPGFPSSPFSLLCQTVKNTVFHPIFLPMFSILSIFTPTKHSGSVLRGVLIMLYLWENHC